MDETITEPGLFEPAVAALYERRNCIYSAVADRRYSYFFRE
ncbi:MAG TPA: hypothetical protein VFU08_01730 [Candidatus Udaeobacter sp.]|nr:hypothetical protein [Candidatus Udaeobacter sp.]